MINLLKKYLDLNQYSNAKQEFEDAFLSHPNYPSLYAITDSLTLLSIENIAVRIEKEQFDQLPQIFLSFFNNVLVLVSKTNDQIVIEHENGSKNNLSNNEFLENWNGIVLAIEPNENITVTKKHDLKWVQWVLPFVILIPFSIILQGTNIVHISLLISTIIGIVISIFILQEKFGIKNELSSKICTLSSKTAGCDSIIQSNYGTINKWISLADLPLLFFGTNMLSLLLSQNLTIIIVLVSILCVPVILYSIWIQQVKIKKWCSLCLIVSGIITFQALLSVIQFKYTFNFSLLAIFYYVLSVFMVSITWSWIKTLLENKIVIEKSNISLKKFKRNYTVFNYLSKQIQDIKNFNNLQGITFGEHNSSMQLTLILSPSCGHCHQALQDALNLINQITTPISLKILFNINPNNNNNPYKIVVKTLLTLQYTNPTQAKEALIDWHINKIGLEKWQTKWQTNTVSTEANEQIHEQYEWCVANELNYTPVKIINQKLFPIEYDIAELKYFLSDLLEETIIKNDIAVAT